MCTFSALVSATRYVFPVIIGRDPIIAEASAPVVVVVSDSEEVVSCGDFSTVEDTDSLFAVVRRLLELEPDRSCFPSV